MGKRMADTMCYTQADSPTLKRSFTPDVTSNCYFHAETNDSETSTPIYTSLGSPIIVCPVPTVGQSRRVTSFGRRRRSNTCERMSSEASARMFAPQMPSFASVFGEADTNRPDREGLTQRNEASAQTVTLKRPATSGGIGSAANGASSFASFHQHHDSTSTSNTSNSDSADTSPTTSISTIDSASMSDPSPGVSPESPASTVSPASAIMDNPRFRSLETRGPDGKGPFFELQRPATPQKKARNLKNLAVSTSGLLSLGTTRALPPAAINPAPGANPISERTSAPASPSFVKPPTPPQRRRPSALGLTIKTPGHGNLPAKLSIPPTPSFSRPNTLRHFQSSPSLPLFTPSYGPKEGMRLPPIRPLIPASNGFAEVPMEEEEQEPNFDVPQSREDKPEAYPNGPITIYESGVDLFYEPTAETASQYDVILNVASEVKNPFEVAAQGASLFGSNSSAQILQDRSQMSNTVGVLSTDAQQTESPDTPKATPIDPPNTLISAALPEPAPSRPEYIHIPWEHNTDIVPDLYKLVTVIDDRVQQKKRVLVHCQCGVSRSASLIVAYGLFKNPGMSVQEAYDAVKKRSKWIGPNMSLIMQLQEFHSGLEQARRDPSFRQKIFGADTPRGLLPRISPAMPSNMRGAFESRLTPGPRPLRSSSARNGDVSPQRASTGDIVPSSAGPVPRVPGSFWDSSYRRSWGASDTTFSISDVSPPPVPSLTVPFVDPAGHVVPVQPSITSNPTSEHQEDLFHQPPRRVPNFSRPTPERTVSADFLASLRPSPPPVIDSSPISPRVSEFETLSLDKTTHECFSLMSPTVSAFPILNPLEPRRELKEAPRTLTPPLELLMSPTATSFPAFPNLSEDKAIPESATLVEPVEPVESVEAVEAVESPEVADFGMHNLGHEDTEDFGILSPTATSFPTNPFESTSFLRNLKGDTLPSEMHGIHTITEPLRSKTPTPSRPSPWGETSSSPPNASSVSPEALVPLSTPSPPRRLRAKFSSPSLREQIRLQEMQNEIAKNILPRPMDDTDALLSPRAGEFINNPFHGDRQSVKLEQPSTPRKSSNADQQPGVLGDELGRKNVHETDPRSPAHVGISPIVRNIWDVLE